MTFRLIWTGLDSFFAVRSGFFCFCHNRQPVAVAVRQNWAERPDRTGPLNTNPISHPGGRSLLSHRDPISHPGGRSLLSHRDPTFHTGERPLLSQRDPSFHTGEWPLLSQRNPTFHTEERPQIGR